ncbi:MAG: LPS-assembly protein LptD [Burkholderiales bacterium]|nr:LPS-assembly protein LptD [Phycisphaerae bacterium]
MITHKSRKQSPVLIAALMVLAGFASRPLTAHAQYESPTDFLQIDTDTAETFNDGTTQVVYIPTPVTIRTDRATLTAKSAVVWFSTVEGSVLNRQKAEIALIGDAKIEQGAIARSGDRLFVSAVITGPVRLTVETRRANDARQTDLYRTAADMRPVVAPDRGQVDNVLIQRPWIDASNTPPATQPSIPVTTPKSPVRFFFKDAQTSTATPDGNIAAILKGDVTLIQERPSGDIIVLQAQQAVVFTTVNDFANLKGGAITSLQEAVTAAYLEGDVRITFTPAAGKTKGGAEQRLLAEKVYYEFATDRAVLTDVILESTDPRVPFPITTRARTVRQLALGEYKTEGSVLTTSQFASPSYSVNSTKAYLRQYDKNDGYGVRTEFEADNATFRLFGVPVFYLPRAAGEVSERGLPLRTITFGGERSFGVGVATEWGLFETLGRLPPEGLDASYRLDYYTDRGPAGGFDASYKGGFVTDVTRQGWNFQGDFTSYLVYDDGQDRLGRERARLSHEGDVRGRFQWQHQHFLPDNWQVQLRAGYTSDATFLEEWFEKEFNDGLPTNLSAYAKRQENTEALTFLMEYQVSDLVTTADALQERFPGDGNSFTDKPFEVDRLPEVGYYRVGDSLGDDQFTFFSENRLGGLMMHESGDDLSAYGFQANAGNDRFASPGIPSAGYTGTSSDYNIRGDFRQEIDYPIDAGEYRIVPYVMARFTGYTDSPGGGAENRLLAGIGTRVTTAFWNIDDSAQSDFWDIHRIRHVVEPELHLFASAATVERNDVFVYDETIDGVSDIAAASLVLRQRWQTKRGGPGRWRNVDFLSLNVGVTGFANQPDEPENRDRLLSATDDERIGPLNAEGFRGLFFQSMPEASIPRSNIFADAQWRVSDSTILLSDISWNIEQQRLATTSAGLLVGRGERVSYFTGLRYIGELDSTIASFNSSYQISAKYSANFNAAVDLAKSSSRSGSFNVVRKFDRFYLSVGAYYDAVEDTSGLQFSFYPEGLSGVNSGQLSNFAR